MDALDWDFRDAKTSYLTHGLHPYPAKYIPQIPNALIQELSSVGETVLDIFCGSGTTLVEALLLKRHCIGIDANPLACLISKAKTQYTSSADLQTLTELQERASTFGTALNFEADGLFQTEGFSSKAPRPLDGNLQFWFPSSVIEELAELRAWIFELQSEAARTLALTCFSAIIVNVSYQDSDTRYVRREKHIARGEVFNRFARVLANAISASKEWGDIVEPRFSSVILEANVLDSPQIPRADLVVCSPPYPNAFSYHLYHRTRMLWLGYDQPRFKREEIGSHRKFSRRAAFDSIITDFRDEVRRIFDWLRYALAPHRHACFVIGNSTVQGRSVNNSDIFSEIGSELGFQEVTRIGRSIAPTKKAFNPSIGRIKTEEILVLQNGSV